MTLPTLRMSPTSPTRRIAFSLLSTILYVLVSLPTFAQENFMDGYIVKKNKDSLRGQIDYRDWGFNPVSIVFQDPRSGVKTSFGTADLLAFGVGAERYEARMVHIRPYSAHPENLTNQEEVGNPYDTTVFLQVIVSGNFSLWELRQASDANYYFVTGRNGAPDQLQLETWINSAGGTTTFEQREVFKDQLAALMSDCPAMRKQIGGTAYRANALRKLVLAYNGCGGNSTGKGQAGSHSGDGNSAEMGEPGHGAGIRFFPVVGYRTGQVKFAGSDDPEVGQQWPSSGSLVAGAGALILLPRRRQQFSFVTDLVWQRWHSESNTTAVNFFTTTTGHVDYSLLQLDILFRYRYPSGDLRPFIEGGMANAMAMNINCYETYSNTNDGTHYNEPLLNGALNHYQQAWILGAGLGGRHWSLEGRWETSRGISASEGTGSRTNSVYILASFPL